jgi:hypothetical protein
LSSFFSFAPAAGARRPPHRAPGPSGGQQSITAPSLVKNNCDILSRLEQQLPLLCFKHGWEESGWRVRYAGMKLKVSFLSLSWRRKWNRDFNRLKIQTEGLIDFDPN